MHASYLNSIYHPDQLDYWRRETVEEPGCWQGVSGYDYIGRHLGYRFHVSDISKKKKELQITIRNSGFGNMCEEAECFLVTESGSGKAACKLLDTDARDWKSGQEAVVPALLSQEGSAGDRRGAGRAPGCTYC